MNLILPYDDYYRDNSRVTVRGFASSGSGLKAVKNKFNKRILLFLMFFCGYLKKKFPSFPNREKYKNETQLFVRTEPRNGMRMQ